MKIEPGMIQSKDLIGLRECVHCPTVTVISSIEVYGTEPLIFTNKELTEVRPNYGDNPVGVVDPYLDQNTPIPPNTPFLMFLLPGKVKNIHHEFDITV